MTASAKPSFQEKFKVVKIIHIALVSSVTLVYTLLGKLQSLDFLDFTNVSMKEIPFMLVPIGALLFGNALYKKTLQKASKDNSLEENLPTYQTACIIRWACIEAAAFFVFFVATPFLLVGIILLLYLAYLYPSISRMGNDLKSANP